MSKIDVFAHTFLWVALLIIAAYLVSLAMNKHKCFNSCTDKQPDKCTTPDTIRKALKENHAKMRLAQAELSSHSKLAAEQAAAFTRVKEEALDALCEPNPYCSGPREPRIPQRDVDPKSNKGCTK
jgi:hypothetical protein